VVTAPALFYFSFAALSSLEINRKRPGAPKTRRKAKRVDGNREPE
jgi:hypothetical protein